MNQKIRPYKLNTSADPKHTPSDSFIDALNIRVSDNSNGGEDGTGDAGVLKNVSSNRISKKVNDFDLPKNYNSAKYMTLGSVTDYKTDITYFFIWSSILKEHGIYAYDPHGLLPKNTEGYSDVTNNHIRLIYKSGLLNFDKDSFVKADIIHSNLSEFSKHESIENRLKSISRWDDMSSDAIIYFTDNKNEPKKINAYRALLNNKAQTSGSDLLEDGYTNYGMTTDEMDFIHACAKTPIKKIVADFINDPNYGDSNFKTIQGMQFAYQWVYKDGIESSISVYSNIAVPKARLLQGSNTSPNYTLENACRLKIPCGTKEVSTIKIYVKDGDSSNFLFIEEVDRAEGNQPIQIYFFRNDKVLTGVSNELVSKQYDAVPLKAQAQTTAYDRLWYGNYTSGFENVDVSATITPLYDGYTQDVQGDIKAYPRTRTSPSNVPISDPSFLNLSGKFNGGASFIIDASEVTSLLNGQDVNFNMTIRPDKNFHIFRRHGWLSSRNTSNINNPDQLSVEANPFLNFNFYNDTQIDAIQEVDYFYLDSSGTQLHQKSQLGTYAGSPIIIQGGDLSFSVSFTYVGPSLYGASAKSFVSNTIARVLSGDIPDENVVTNLLAINPTHQVSLGLSNLQKIQVGKPNLVEYGDQDLTAESLSYLICNIPKLEDDISQLDQAPIGYYIIDKCKIQFKMQFVESSGSYSQVLLTPKQITEIDAYTCIKRPNDNYWRVLNTNFFNGSVNGQNLISFFNQIEGDYYVPSVTQSIDGFFNIYQDFVGLADEITNIQGEIQPLTFENVIDGFYNYRNQFGFINSIPDIIFEDQPFYYDQTVDSINGVFLMDGESGIGGSNGPTYWQDRLMNNMGSAPGIITSLSHDNEHIIHGLDPGEQWGVMLDGGQSQTVYRRVIAFGPFFTGGMSFFGISPAFQYRLVYQEAPFGSSGWTINMSTIQQSDYNIFIGQQEGKEINSFPLITGKVPLNYVVNTSPYDVYDYDDDETHPEIEIINQFGGVAEILTENFKSFKSSSYHDFGVVYYDERGRHGFVNHAGTVYVKGYSDIERENKGRASIQIKMNSQPPSWAKKWKVVHSKSTSIDSFIQYSAGGAFVRPSSADDDGKQNIYVSLNYLQGSIMSYASSFGARSPEGSPILYSFTPGDRLRIISYENSSGVRQYDVSNNVFEIVDLKILGSSENPLVEGGIPPANNQKGYFLVLKNNISSSGFSYADVLSENHKWNHNTIIEIFTPSKNQTQKIYYEIGNDFEIDFNSGQLNAHSPSVIVLNDGDVWWRRVAVNLRDPQNFNDLIIDYDDGNSDESASRFKNVILESSTSTDLVKADSVGLGRPNVVYDDAMEVVNESSVTYSDPTSKSGYRLKYSSFNNSLLNFKDVDSSYGSINYLINKDGFLFVITENRILRLPIKRNILSTSDGSYDVVSSTDIVSDPIVSGVQSGCDGNPESVVDNGDYIYFVNKSMHKVFRATNSGEIEDISSIGMTSFFRDLFRSSSNVYDTKFTKINGGYDPMYDEYILSINDYDIETLSLIDDAVVYGCTDPNACNYNENATQNDGSCLYSSSCYDCDGNLIDGDQNGICDSEDIFGCTNPDALNYNPEATADDGSCVIGGCMDPDAVNFNINASIHVEGSCVYETDISCGPSQITIDNQCVDLTMELFVQTYGLTVGHFMALEKYGVDTKYFFNIDIDQKKGWIGQAANLDFQLAYALYQDPQDSGANIGFGYSNIIEPSDTSLKETLDAYISNQPSLSGIPFNDYTNIIYYMYRGRNTYSQLKSVIPPLLERLNNGDDDNAGNRLYLPFLYNQTFDSYEQDDLANYQVELPYSVNFLDFNAAWGTPSVDYVDETLTNEPVIPQ